MQVVRGGGQRPQRTTASMRRRTTVKRSRMTPRRASNMGSRSAAEATASWYAAAATRAVARRWSAWREQGGRGAGVKRTNRDKRVMRKLARGVAAHHLALYTHWCDAGVAKVGDLAPRMSAAGEPRESTRTHSLSTHLCATMVGAVALQISCCILLIW